MVIMGSEWFRLEKRIINSTWNSRNYFLHGQIASNEKKTTLSINIACTTHPFTRKVLESRKDLGDIVIKRNEIVEDKRISLSLNWL